MYMYLGDRGPRPGTVLKVRCTEFPLIEHWGMCYWPDPFTGQPRMIHGMKNDVFRITSRPEFDYGQPCSVAWTPETQEQRIHAIARMELLLGRPWDLFSLNCEQGVMWALTDMPVSQQLNGGLVLAGVAVLVAIGVAASD
jgi:hypothetical protein